MSSQEHLVEVDKRRSANDSRSASAVFSRFMKGRQCALRETEPIVQDVNQEMVDRQRLLHKGLDGGLHASVDRARVSAMDRSRPGKRVVLGDVQELCHVASTFVINELHARPFVSGLE